MFSVYKIVQTETPLLHPIMSITVLIMARLKSCRTFSVFNAKQFG